MPIYNGIEYAETIPSASRPVKVLGAVGGW
jgi:hypothetical protein